MELLTNRNTQLTPRTAFDGPTLTFDFPGLQIGVAEYDEGPTGCTVFCSPAARPRRLMSAAAGWVGRLAMNGTTRFAWPVAHSMGWRQRLA